LDREERPGDVGAQVAVDLCGVGELERAGLEHGGVVDDGVRPRSPTRSLMVVAAAASEAGSVTSSVTGCSAG